MKVKELSLPHAGQADHDSNLLDECSQNLPWLSSSDRFHDHDRDSTSDRFLGRSEIKTRCHTKPDSPETFSKDN